MSDHYDRYNGMEELLSTNLEEVGTDCISRQAAIIQLSHNKNKGDDEWELAVENDIQTIWELPSAEPKRGKWVKDKSGYLVCDQCRDVYINPEWPADGHWKFCPNCGADMRGEQNEH